MVSIVLSGEAGTGKTMQSILGFQEPVRILDMENRLNPKLKIKTLLKQYPELNGRLLDIIELKKLDGDFMDDYLASYYALINEKNYILSKITEDSNFFETLVIDGISDIRNKYAKAKWHEDHPKRKNPRVEEWSFMNEETINIISPLINMSRALNKNLILTAQMKDEYTTAYQDLDGTQIKTSAKCGRSPISPDFIDFQVDVVANIYHPDQGSKGINLSKYYINITKSPIGSWTEDITNKTVYDILYEKGL